MRTSTLIRTAALLAVFNTPLARAHIVLEQASAPAGAYQKLTFRVGHGCGESATTGLTVILPEAITGAKPMPKAGWSLSTAQAPLNTPLESHGKTITSTVREVSWKGGPLPDAWYDEFSIQVKLPQTPGKYYFKVIQLCEKGRMDWVETPAASGAVPKAPAPVLDVVPAAGQAHQH
jgi:periplasmic copper chaperone A